MIEVLYRYYNEHSGIYTFIAVDTTTGKKYVAHSKFSEHKDLLFMEL